MRGIDYNENIFLENAASENINEKTTDAEARDKITKKAEAIRKQSPQMSDDAINEQAKKEVDNFVEIWGAINKIGAGWYSIKGESREKMTEWKEQISKISNILDSGNIKQMINDDSNEDFKMGQNELKKSFYESTGIHLDKIPANIRREVKEFNAVFDDEAKTLLSISLWFKQQQGGKWAGSRKIFWKILSKDSEQLSSFLDKNGAPACVDTSFLFKAMAEEFGIKGEVEKDESISGIAPHYYYQSENGKVLDYWWASGRERDKNTGGLKINQDSYIKMVKEMDKSGISNICGTQS